MEKEDLIEVLLKHKCVSSSQSNITVLHKHTNELIKILNTLRFEKVLNWGIHDLETQWSFFGKRVQARAKSVK